MTPRRVLRLLGTRDPRVFVVGVNEERVTLLSQQTRALNLVWALDRASSAGIEGQRVVVLGGGAAGATAAAAAAAACLKADVKLLSSHDLFEVQRTATHRYLHPFLYEWPAPQWNRERARLPLLDWEAGDGRTVADALANETAALRRRLGFQVFDNVLPPNLNVDPWTGEFTIRTRTPGGEELELQPEIVLLSVGFGREAPHPAPPDGVYWDSYWLDDDLVTRSGRILVSGQGDGGLTEVLRCLIDGFEHREVLELGRIAQRDLGPDRVNAIIQRELDLADDSPTRGTQSFYDSFDLPRLEAWLRRRLKPDTEVVLACRGEPLQRGSSPLNRLLVAQLAKISGALRLDHRGIDENGLRSVVRDGTTAPFLIPWADGRSEPFDIVVVRHGTAIPRPMDTYSGSFPPVLTQDHARGSLGWALDLTRFQWWERQTFSRCASTRGPRDEHPPESASLVGPPVPGPPGDVDPALPSRDPTAALLRAVLAWGAEADVSLSHSLLSRVAEARGDTLEAVERRSSPTATRAHVSWRTFGDAAGWSELRQLAREILIIDLAGRRTVSDYEAELLDALLAPSGDRPLDDVRASDALRRARPNDPAAALAVYTRVNEQGLGREDRRAASLAYHALDRAVRLGATGEEAAR
jgi:hypothetical protein